MTARNFSVCLPQTEGGQNAPLPTLAILSQMTMKLGKDILSVEIFTN